MRCLTRSRRKVGAASPHGWSRAAPLLTHAPRRCGVGTADEVFEEVKPALTSLMDGYNVTLFAYGQTGSGKTVGDTRRCRGNSGNSC
jgi:hypothetical protein